MPYPCRRQYSQAGLVESGGWSQQRAGVRLCGGSIAETGLFVPFLPIKKEERKDKKIKY